MGWFQNLFGGATGGVERIEGARARSLVEQGATLVDVRTPGEFSGGHLPGALNIPVDAIGRRADEIDRNRPVVLYCRSGARSANAGRQLKHLGLEAVYDLGAMSRW